MRRSRILRGASGSALWGVMMGCAILALLAGAASCAAFAEGPGVGPIVIGQLPAPLPKDAHGADWTSTLWPIVVLILAFSFRRGIADLFRAVTSIKGPGGVEIAFGPEASKKVSSYFQDAYKELIDQAKKDYDHQVDVNRVYERLGDVVRDTVRAVLQGQNVEVPAQYRGTIHVPDVVFGDYLYQLTNYFPAERVGGAGRRFSQRYGIIGRAWRLKRSLGKGNAIPAGDPQAVIDTLVGEWGMLPSEAMPGSRGSPSFLCVLLRSSQMGQGVIYIDSPGQNAFGNDDVAAAVAERLEAEPTTLLLADVVRDAMKTLRESGTFLTISQ